jgi:hypothetical protein
MVAAASTGAPKDELAQTLNKLDREGGAYMKHTEKKCRRLKSGRIPFSPEASLWIHQCQVYCSLLQWHNRKLWNYGNLCRTAQCCQINAPFKLTIDDIKLRMSICKEKCDFFLRHGQCHRQQHLTNCLEAAQEREDGISEQNILAIIKRKRTKPSGAGSTTLSGSMFAAKVCGQCKSKMVLVGCWTSTPRRQCRRQSLMKFTASNIT